MSEAKHTPGRLQATPWGNSDCSGWDLTINAHLLPLSDASSATEDEAEANARRLVACWNACQHVSTELLEEFPAPFGELRARHDQMLEALRKIAEAPNNTLSDGKALKEIMRIARAAIAKATAAP